MPVMPTDAVFVPVASQSECFVSSALNYPCLSHSFLHFLELPYGDAQAARRKKILATFMISHNSALS